MDKVMLRYRMMLMLSSVAIVDEDLEGEEEEDEQPLQEGEVQFPQLAAPPAAVAGTDDAEEVSSFRGVIYCNRMSERLQQGSVDGSEANVHRLTRSDFTRVFAASNTDWGSESTIGWKIRILRD